MLNESTQDLLLLATTQRDAEVSYELGGTVSEETRKRFDEIISDGDGSIPKYSTITPIVWYKVLMPSWSIEQLICATPEYRILLVEKPDRSLWIWRPDHGNPKCKFVRIEGSPVLHYYYKMVKKGGAL